MFLHSFFERCRFFSNLDLYLFLSLLYGTQVYSFAAIPAICRLCSFLSIPIELWESTAAIFRQSAGYVSLIYLGCISVLVLQFVFNLFHFSIISFIALPHFRSSIKYQFRIKLKLLTNLDFFDTWKKILEISFFVFCFNRDASQGRLFLPAMFFYDPDFRDFLLDFWNLSYVILCVLDDCFDRAYIIKDWR